jgi:hypothetical protein
MLFALYQHNHFTLRINFFGKDIGYAPNKSMGVACLIFSKLSYNRYVLPYPTLNDYIKTGLIVDEDFSV